MHARDLSKHSNRRMNEMSIQNNNDSSESSENNDLTEQIFERIERSGSNFVASTIQTVQNYGRADKTGEHVKGEKYSCDSGKVKCVDVSVQVPKGGQIMSIRRFARQEGGQEWYADPVSTIYWADWVGPPSISALSDGRINVSVTLKNWRASFAREVFLQVSYVI